MNLNSSDPERTNLHLIGVPEGTGVVMTLTALGVAGRVVAVWLADATAGDAGRLVLLLLFFCFFIFRKQKNDWVGKLFVYMVMSSW